MHACAHPAAGEARCWGSRDGRGGSRRHKEIRRLDEDDSKAIEGKEQAGAEVRSAAASTTRAAVYMTF